MLNKIFPKIDKSRFPKPVRHWSLSVLFVYPVFVIVNKLWPFLYIYIIINLINFNLIVFKLDKYIIDLISVFTWAILMFFTFYLVIYGRILAWQKLGYKDTQEDIAKFKLRQRIVLYVNILVIGLLMIYLLAGLEYGHQINVLS